jgi:hypothetical protein
LEERQLRGFDTVYYAPVVDPRGECLILPYEEGFVVYHSRLNDFLSFKYSPSHSVNIIVVDVLLLTVVVIDSLIRNHFILVKVVCQWFYQFLGNEKLIVSLLIDESVFRSPSESRVSAPDSVDLGLRVYREEVVGVHQNQKIYDVLSLKLETTL